MPFKSVAQQHYLFAKKPGVAKKFAAKTPKTAYAKLPKHKTTRSKTLPKKSFIYK